MGLLEEYDATPEGERAAKVAEWLRSRWRELFAELRASRPVLFVPTPRSPRFVLVTRYRDVVEVLSHEREFSVQPYGEPMDAVLGGPFLLSRDDTPLNWRERGVMQVVLSRDDLRRVRHAVGRWTDEALDAAAERGVVDLVDEVGRAVPIRLCEEYFGFVGPDPQTMRRWSRDIHLDAFRNSGRDGGLRTAARTAGEEVRAHLECLVERRSAELRDAVQAGRQPVDVAPDVLGRLLRLTLPQEVPFDDGRVVVNLVGLLVGSVETTSQAVVQVVHHLLADPALQQLAAQAAAGEDRAAFDRIVWEALRFDPVNVLLLRRCERAYELGRGSGSPVVIPAETRVLACTGSALFDEQALDRPEAFDPERPSRIDLHFGFGHHSCLGRHLAEQVVPEMVRRVLLRPGVSLLPGQSGALDRSGPLPERFRVALPGGPSVGAQAAAADGAWPQGRCTDRDGRLNRLELWLLTHGEPVWSGVQRSPLLQGTVNKRLIDRAALRLPPRPNPLSTMAEYSSWPSLVDRRYDARHLAPVPGPVRAEPALEDLLTLFARGEQQQRSCPKSTMLFAYFAQWFTDGFLRSATGLVGQNETSHEIDLSQLYGRTPEATQSLRSGADGQLKSQRIGGEEFPPYLCEDGNIKAEFGHLSVVRFPQIARSQRNTLFALGSDRAHTLAGMTMINVLFLREHNRIARLLACRHPHWDDDRLFQTARNTLTVVLLKIVLEDYVNHLTPYHFQFSLDPQRLGNPRWYRTNRVAIEFNLLYRWHSLMPSRLTVGGRERPLAECIADMSPLPQRGLGAMYVEASAQAAGRIGLHNTDELLLRDTELASLRQAREVRLDSYNAYRVRCGFPRVTAVDQITADVRVQDELKRLYPGGVDDIELYVGLFAEDPRPGSPLGPLMGRMVGVDALSQALTNPLLAKQVYGWDTFGAGMGVIRDTHRLIDVVRRNVPPGTADGYISLTRETAAAAPPVRDRVRRVVLGAVAGTQARSR